MVSSNSVDSERKVSSNCAEEEYIVEPWKDSPSSACVDNSISTEPVHSIETGKATMLSTKAFKMSKISNKKYSITKGQKIVPTSIVGSGAKFLRVVLDWEDKNDVLKLSCFTPSGRMKPNNCCYDNSDRRIDSKIDIKISPENGKLVEKGTWRFEVYGEKISGKKDFTFAVTQN